MESNNRYICVYGASSDNIADEYKHAAYTLGKELAKQGWNCINGAGSAGVMRAVSDGFLDAGAKTIGIIPQFMVDNGWQYDRLSQIIATPDMHQRKQTMAERSSCSIAMPGGCGTLEELFEIITWKQLGLYKKPLIIFNINGFFNNILQQINTCINENFMKPSHSNLWYTANNVQQVIDYIANYDEQATHSVESKI
ncbi:MAG: TIGR00730 family Rossman fold protein [Muribaculaceae bacterium]